MQKKYLLIAALTGLLIGPATAISENMQGTGLHSLLVISDSDGRVVLQAVQDNTNLIGSAATEQNYGELILDRIASDGQLTPSWGKAEVLLGCYQADVLLYQQQQNTWVELAALQVGTEYCLQ